MFLKLHKISNFLPAEILFISCRPHFIQKMPRPLNSAPCVLFIYSIGDPDYTKKRFFPYCLSFGEQFGSYNRQKELSQMALLQREGRTQQFCKTAGHGYIPNAFLVIKTGLAPGRAKFKSPLDPSAHWPAILFHSNLTHRR